MQNFLRAANPTRIRIDFFFSFLTISKNFKYTSQKNWDKIKGWEKNRLAAWLTRRQVSSSGAMLNRGHSSSKGR